MSLRESNAMARAGSGGALTLSTVVSCSPATTWAFVTTTPGATTQPEPETPSPHAVPSTRTTLGAARRTPALRRTEGSGGPTRGTGPVMEGNGSTRASARKALRGGTSSLSRRRTAERCTSRRKSGWPGSWSATAAMSHTSTSPESAPKASPPIESAVRNRSGSLRRSAAPADEPTSSKRTAKPAAPASATSGV